MTGIQIATASSADAALLAGIGRQSFVESHGHSAAAEDIRAYMDRKLTPGAFAEELADPGNLFRIIRVNGEPAGYSKLIPGCGHPLIARPNVAKLERLYILERFLDRGLGTPLLHHNLSLARELAQAGIWLFVWTENARAVRFYEKSGFRVIGQFDFPVSERHSNPNHQMFLDL
ncbi:MAG: GNAT family N-acetyltransferase [Chitinophagaceae bacterium]|nr:MAG: GNAT family N-acetyltransferase [Chitinophagaceae bacterium]